ncbi:MAG: hypothetical protein PHP54_05995 [Clostridia bacterium]|nr:hypothetical protein [Clostridia bacterium]
MPKLVFMKNSAEPSHIFCNGQERMSQSITWQHTMPPLFPILGDTNCPICIDGNPYYIPNHGFVKDAQYDEMSIDGNSTTFTFHFERDNLHCPYNVNFSVAYEPIKENELAITYIIDNLDDKEICFSVGGNPGFSLIPGTKPEDYEISFLCEDSKLFSSSPYYSNVEINNNSVHMKSIEPDKPFFVSGFKEEMHKKMCYVSYQGKLFVRLTFYNDTKHFGIWYREDKENPFICLEPWSSPPISQIGSDFSSSLEVLKVKPKARHTFCYEILFIPYFMR